MKMNPMILSLALALMTACGSGSGKDDTADAGGSDCAVYGSQVAASETCEEDASVYEDDCEDGLVQATAAGCGPEAEDYLQCTNDAGYDFDCSFDGDPAVELTEDDPCEAVLDTYIACFLAG